MASHLLAALAVLSAASTASSAASVRYDQTQTGSTNVHLQIKNVELVALLDDSAGSEYDYDYSDFTVKPPKPGSTSIYNSTAVSSNTNTTAGSANNSTSDNTTNSTSDSTTSSTYSSSVADTTAASISEIKEPLVSSTVAPGAAEGSVVEAASPPAKVRRCGAGFYRDTLGRCRRIRRPHLQMMVNLARTKPTSSHHTP